MNFIYFNTVDYRREVFSPRRQDDDDTVSLLILIRRVISLIGHPFQGLLRLQSRIE